MKLNNKKGGLFFLSLALLSLVYLGYLIIALANHSGQLEPVAKEFCESEGMEYSRSMCTTLSFHCNKVAVFCDEVDGLQYIERKYTIKLR